jgi:hypothetical protein
MYADDKSRGGWIAVGMLSDGSHQWATSEWVYKDKKQAVDNLKWCYDVIEESVKTVKVGLK